MWWGLAYSFPPCGPPLTGLTCRSSGIPVRTPTEPPSLRRLPFHFSIMHDRAAAIYVYTFVISQPLLFVTEYMAFQVLERVAFAYPRALFFPLLMTKASAARRAGDGTGAVNDGGRLSKLTGLTADPSGEAFAEVSGAKQIALVRSCLGRRGVLSGALSTEHTMK